MRRTFAYIFSLSALLIAGTPAARCQDTILYPLKVNIGIEAIGPVTYIFEKKTFNASGYVSVDLNEKLAVAFEAGYLDYYYSQYNYTYLCNGFFVRAGTDFNILKPKKSLGKYWGGVGFRYGISRFGWEVPELSQSNYWGKATSSIPPTTNWGHFLEASPGMRAEVFRNFSMGWSVNLRMRLYTGTYNGIRPIYFPGFGSSDKRFTAGFSYYLVWNIPYKKIRVITKKPEPEEEEEEPEDIDIQQQRGTQSSGLRQQQSFP
jgi:hypothetical protein